MLEMIGELRQKPPSTNDTNLRLSSNLIPEKDDKIEDKLEEMNMDVPKVSECKRQKLEFVHITKTGGVAITQLGSSLGIKWGICHWKKVNECKAPCDTVDIIITKNHDDLYNKTEIPVKYRTTTEPWHSPPHWFKDNPYKNADTFTVLRNPYDRVLSEYYSKFGGYVGPNKENATVLNQWVQKRLSVILRQAHFLPHYFYVFDKRDKQVIDHVLRYENLSEEFPALVNKYYEYDVNLNERFNQRVSGDSMAISDFSQETINMINTYYEKDFASFNYPMLH